MINSFRLSQALIVKNEEDNIERALSWGRSFLDEQIVVDTGSTDRTVEIAKRCGAAVYHFDWVNDFSAAKNFALEKCTGDWIFFLDADEYLEPADPKQIKKALQNATAQRANSISCTLVNLSDTMEELDQAVLIRILKNEPGLHYYYPIHEQILFPSGLKTCNAAELLTIKHTGYTREAIINKDKTRRNLEIINHYLAQNPNDYVMISYLADEYRSVQDYRAAISSYYSAIEKMPDSLSADSQRAIYTFCYLMEILVTLYTASEKDTQLQNLAKDISIQAEQILDLYQTASTVFPKEASFDYWIGYFYYKKKLFCDAISAFQQTLAKLAAHPNALGQINQNFTGNVYALLGDSFFHAEDYEHALEFSVKALSLEPYNPTAGTVLLSVGKALLRQRAATLDQFLPIVTGLYSLENTKNLLFLHHLASDISFEEFEQKILSYFTEEELQKLFKKI